MVIDIASFPFKMLIVHICVNVYIPEGKSPWITIKSPLNHHEIHVFYRFNHHLPPSHRARLPPVLAAARADLTGSGGSDQGEKWPVSSVVKMGQHCPWENTWKYICYNVGPVRLQVGIQPHLTIVVTTISPGEIVVINQLSYLGGPTLCDM